MRSASWGTSVRPSVATEIVWRARSMVTASSAGSLARASATERVRQCPGSFCSAVFDSVVVLINPLSSYDDLGTGAKKSRAKSLLDQTKTQGIVLPHKERPRLEFQPQPVAASKIVRTELWQSNR